MGIKSQQIAVVLLSIHCILWCTAQLYLIATCRLFLYQSMRVQLYFAW